MCKTAQWHAHGCLANSWYLKENQKSVLTLSIKYYLALGVKLIVLINRNMVLFPSFTLHKVRLCTSFLDLYYFLQLFMWIGLYLGIKKWIGWGFFTTKKKKMRKIILVWKTLHKVCLKSVESFPRFSIISSILEQRNLQYSIELILVPIFSLRKLSWYKVNVLRVNAKLLYFVWLGH